jgi:hypothetical protein
MSEQTDETQSGNPGDPLSGRSGNLHELLRSLSDAELETYCLYWSRRHAEYAGNGFASWKCSNLLAAGYGEARTRFGE